MPQISAYWAPLLLSCIVAAFSDCNIAFSGLLVSDVFEISVPEDTALDTTIAAFSPPLSIEWIEPSAVVTATGGVVKLATPLDFESSSLLSVRFTEQCNVSYSLNRTLTIRVQGVNEQPSFPSTPSTPAVELSMLNYKTLTPVVRAEDPESDALTYSITSTDPSSAMSAFSIDSNLGVVLVERELLDVSRVMVHIQAADPGGLMATTVLNASILPVPATTPAASQTQFFVRTTAAPSASAQSSAMSSTTVITIVAIVVLLLFLVVIAVLSRRLYSLAHEHVKVKTSYTFVEADDSDSGSDSGSDSDSESGQVSAGGMPSLHPQDTSRSGSVVSSEQMRIWLAYPKRLPRGWQQGQLLVDPVFLVNPQMQLVLSKVESVSMAQLEHLVLVCSKSAIGGLLSREQLVTCLELAHCASQEDCHELAAVLFGKNHLISAWTLPALLALCVQASTAEARLGRLLDLIALTLKDDEERNVNDDLSMALHAVFCLSRVKCIGLSPSSITMDKALERMEVPQDASQEVVITTLKANKTVQKLLDLLSMPDSADKDAPAQSEAPPKHRGRLVSLADHVMRWTQRLGFRRSLRGRGPSPSPSTDSSTMAGPRAPPVGFPQLDGHDQQQKPEPALKEQRVPPAGFPHLAQPGAPMMQVNALFEQANPETLPPAGFPQLETGVRDVVAEDLEAAGPAETTTPADAELAADAAVHDDVEPEVSEQDMRSILETAASIDTSEHPMARGTRRSSQRPSRFSSAASLVSQ